MTPEANRFLAKAHRLLQDAATMLGVGLTEAAGRTAYLAGFHAAQAFIFEITGKIFKSHNGVQTEFLRLTKADPRFRSDQRIFLSQSYNLKTIADYEAGSGSEISAERAAYAVEAGNQFVTHIAELLAQPQPEHRSES
ncbi:MAG: HEPN domain-containing protein [Methylovirgula sp.]